MWLAFSIPRNLHVLFAEKTDELSKEMSTVNGIRSIGSVEVLIAHVFFRIFSLPFSNTYAVQQVHSIRYASACNTLHPYMNTFLIAAVPCEMVCFRGANPPLSCFKWLHIWSSVYAVAEPCEDWTNFQEFFFCSFRSIYQVTKWNDIWCNPVIFNPLFSRLAPGFTFVVFAYATLVRQIGDGPLWNRIFYSESSICRKNILYQLLFVSNYIKTDEFVHLLGVG